MVEWMIFPAEIDYSDVLHIGTQHSSIAPKEKFMAMLLVIFLKIIQS
jgi:hypothetical protein